MKKFILLALALSGCVQQTTIDWRLADGREPDRQKFEAATTICKGRASTAMLSGTVSEYSPAADREALAMNVYNGCMTEQGLVGRPVTAQK